MLFLIMTIVSIMPITYNLVMGNTLANSGSSLKVIATRMSLGTYTYSASDTLSNQHKLFNVIPDIVNCVIFLVFYIYWSERSKKIIEEIKKEVLFPSYYAVEMNEFPKNISPIMVEDFMGRFGTIKEIAPVKNYSEKIAICKNIYDLETELKEL